MLPDNAAAAAAGSWPSAEPTPTSDDLEYQSSDSFLTDSVTIERGLGLIPNAVFQPYVLYDYRCGWLVSHVYTHPGAVAFGLECGAALEVTPYAATVIGDGAVMAIDGRYARVLEPGENDVIAATWLLLDTFASGEDMSSVKLSATNSQTLPTDRLHSLCYNCGQWCVALQTCAGNRHLRHASPQQSRQVRDPSALCAPRDRESAKVVVDYIGAGKEDLSTGRIVSRRHNLLQGKHRRCVYRRMWAFVEVVVFFTPL